MVLTWRFSAGIEALAGLLGARRPVPFSHDDSGTFVALDLPPIPADHIVVAAFSSMTVGEYAYRFSLSDGAEVAALSGIGSASTDGNSSGNGSPDGSPPPLAAMAACDSSSISAPIDNFITRGPLAAPRLRMDVAAVDVDAACLLTVSVRPVHVAAPTAGVEAAAPRSVAAISQWQHTDPALRPRICLPTCTAMALAGGDDPAAFERIVAECRHASGIYGVWPLATYVASRRGIIASVEVINRMDDVVPLLAHGCTVVASVRFADGELTAAPMRETGGHLILVRGMDRQRVYVNDPAARTSDAVARDYERSAFASIWLRYRGAACVFLPPVNEHRRTSS